MNVEAAASYAERHAPQVLQITVGGRRVLGRFGDGFTPNKPHALYSGTKSFWGVLAAAAVDDGLLTFDEPVGETIPEWKTGERALVTLRNLLQLTSGIGFGGLGSAVPTYERAIAVELKNPAGSHFTYGGIPLQVFGAVLQRKLEERKLTPHQYLVERILDPIGVKVGSWRTLSDGTQPLPTGAFLAAHEWAKYGAFVAAGGVLNGKPLVQPETLAECFKGSSANARYGLGFWLSPLESEPDLVYASGSAGQAMYVQPSRGLIVVRFGNSASYKHEAFLRQLFDTPRAPRRRVLLEQAAQAR